MSLVPPVIIPAAIKQTATIIFLHGLGDTGHGWASEIADIKPQFAKLICPTANENPVTINFGMSMPSWFDIRSLSKEDGNEDVEGIQKASSDIKAMIDEEVKNGIPGSRILLGGFSQGAALSLYTGLTGKELLGGVISLSGYLPARSTITWDSILKPPTLQCHGDSDGIVPYSIGLSCRKVLESNLTDFNFKTYRGMEHSSCEQEMQDVKEFINKVLPQL